jgi:hypothetical protein
MSQRFPVSLISSGAVTPLCRLVSHGQTPYPNRVGGMINSPINTSTTSWQIALQLGFNVTYCKEYHFPPIFAPPRYYLAILYVHNSDAPPFWGGGWHAADWNDEVDALCGEISQTCSEISLSTICAANFHLSSCFIEPLVRVRVHLYSIAVCHGEHKKSGSILFSEVPLYLDVCLHDTTYFG